MEIPGSMPPLIQEMLENSEGQDGQNSERNNTDKNNGTSRNPTHWRGQPPVYQVSFAT